MLGGTRLPMTRVIWGSQSFQALGALSYTKTFFLVL